MIYCVKFPSVYILISHDFLFQTPTVISVGLPTELQTPATQFCLEQKFHGGANRHVWAVDFLQLLPVLPGANTHLVQFSINLGCGAYQLANRWSDHTTVITQKPSFTHPHVIQTCMTSVAHKIRHFEEHLITNNSGQNNTEIPFKTSSFVFAIIFGKVKWCQ